MKGKVAILGLILIFLILNVLDLVLTVMAIENGKGTEANPFMAGLIESGISQYTVVKISVGVIIALLLFVLYKEHLRAARITAAFLVIAYIFIVSNNVIINASAIVIGHNVKAVGGGYSNFYGSGYHEFVYWTSDDGGEIHLVTLDDSGMVVSDTTIVTNVSTVKSLCIDKDGYVWFSIDYSGSSYDGIWKRNTKSTNPLSFKDLKDDSNYFVHITSDIGYGLTPSGNRIYYFTGTTVKYISGASVSTLYDVGGSSIQDLSATVDYIYVLKKAAWNKLNIVVLTHDGELVQEEKIRSWSCSMGSFSFSSALLVFSDYIIDTNKVSSQYCGKYAESFKIELYDNKTVNVSSKTSIATLTSQASYEMAEIAYSPFGVYINSDKQVEIYLSDSVYIPDEGSGGGGGGTGTTQYYNVTLRFVNAETNQELSNVYVKGYVYYNGEIYQSINGYYDYNLTLTVPAGSYIEIQQAHKDLFESDLERGEYYLTVINVQSDTERTIYFYSQIGTTYLEFYFIDAKTNAQIPNVHLVLQDDDGNIIANGTYDYSASFEVWVGKTYYWNASKSGYFNDSGSITIATDQLTYTVWAYLTPIVTPSDPVNNTIVEFIVKSNPGTTGGQYYPLPGAVITMNGESRVTNSNGYAYFEVAENTTYSYIVSKEGYYSRYGTVTVGTEPVLIEIVLDVLVTPTTTTGGTTTTTTTGGITGGYGGEGSTLQEGIDVLYQNASTIISLAVLVTMVNLIRMIGGKRR